MAALRRPQPVVADLDSVRGSRQRPHPDAGEPGILLGTDTDRNPAEYLLHALAACLTTSIVQVMPSWLQLLLVAHCDTA